MTKVRVLLPALILLLTGRTLADDWAAPKTTEVFSPSREFFVRVIPGENFGDSVGFSGAKKGRYAQAQFYQRDQQGYRLKREITLLNPVAPVDFFVSDSGYLVTLDNWHNMGYGKVVVIYRPSGQLVRAFELKDLYSQGDIARLRSSISSIWWRTRPTYIRGDQNSLLASDERGTFVFDLETGTYEYCKSQKGKWPCRNSARK